uniref:Class II aldolase/adducin N-terminal domain-containing protein n=1 Tax=Trichobilharzia regenti TaxID=157069 RepID=A0AA85JT46_TRIRE|nr:unnamed protein product [Trichobilharzia regenti]
MTTDYSDNALSGLSDDDFSQNVKKGLSNHNTKEENTSTFNTNTSHFEHPGHKQGSALQQLSSLLGQTMRLENVADLKEVLKSVGTGCQRSLPTIPINDLRGEEAAAYHREDCVLRRSLAALYRLIDMRGWTHSIYNHISARCTTNPNHFLINPFGLLYHEIQASSLVKIDANGNIVDQGSSVLGVNKAGWTLHSALHSTRKDINCIIHVHLPDVIAVSCLRAGLLPVSPEAIELISNHGVRYHEYRAVAAASIPEAWYIVKRVITACQTQMRLMQLSDGASLLSDLKDSATRLADSKADHPEEEESDALNHQEKNDSALLNGKTSSDNGDHLYTNCIRLRKVVVLIFLTTNIGDINIDVNYCLPIWLEACSHSNTTNLDDNYSILVIKLHNKHLVLTIPFSNMETNSLFLMHLKVSWTPEELEFEAEMRVLDSAGFRTGHVYRQPNLLRRAHPGSSWTGDTYGDQVTGADLLTTDFSNNEFSGVEDIAAAEAAGAEQVAKIVDHVRASRQKNVQRNQWLAKANEPSSHNGIVSSSMIASPREQLKMKNPVDYRPHPFASESPICMPVRRSDSGSTPTTTTDTERNFHSPTESLHGVSGYSTLNGSVSTSATATPSHNITPTKRFNDPSVNKSATLPANVQHMSKSFQQV